jgi:PAS domain-containing protein
MAGAEDPRPRAVDWQQIVMALEHGVVVLDAQTRIVACNAAAEGLLELPPGRLRGRRPSELGLELLAQDGSPLPLEAQPSAWRCAAARCSAVSSSVSGSARASAGWP